MTTTDEQSERDDQALLRHALRVTSEFHRFRANQTNFVQVELRPLGAAIKDLTDDLRERGLLL